MPKSAGILAVALFTLACASMNSDSGLGRATVSLAKPDILIEQVSSVPAVARHVEGGIPVRYQLRVENKSKEPITMKSVTVNSMGYGAYRVETTSRPFQTVVAPDNFQVVEFWVPAFIDNASIMGANGPVTLRLAVQFDSPVGQFQEVVTRQVNAMPGREGAQ